MWTITEVKLTEEEVAYWQDLSKLTLGDVVCKLDLDACIHFANKCTNFLLSRGEDKVLVMFRMTYYGWRLHEVIFHPDLFDEVAEPLSKLVSDYEKPIICMLECPRHEVMRDMLAYLNFKVQYISDKEFVICQA
jgi:hypothetical protein